MIRVRLYCDVCSLTTLLWQLSEGLGLGFFFVSPKKWLQVILKCIHSNKYPVPQGQQLETISQSIAQIVSCL